MFHLSGSHKHGPLIKNVQGFQFTTLKTKTFTIKTHIEDDCFLLTHDNNVIKVLNIVKDKSDMIFLICKIFTNKNILFDKPIQSSELNIYNINWLSHNLHYYSINEIKKKNDCISFGQ